MHLAMLLNSRRVKRFKFFFVLVIVFWIAITFFIFLKSKESTLETDMTSNASRISTLETDMTSNASRISTLETDMTSNTTVVPKEIKGEVSCRWLVYKGKIPICAHPDFDRISDAIARKGSWSDCDMLPALWLELPMHERSRGNFLDLGANIGSCSIEMLLSTNASIVSIEANPENFQRMQKTVLNLSNEFKERIKIYNVAASNVIENVQIFGAVTNMGNSVVGRAVQDDANQVFHKPLSIQTQKLDDILGNVHFLAMKMDVQGYECRALEGMNRIISNMRTIKFKVANRWLLAQGCSDITLFEKLKSFGFDIYHGNGILHKPIARDVYDLVARNKVPKDALHPDFDRIPDAIAAETEKPTIILAAPSGEGTVRRREGAEFNGTTASAKSAVNTSVPTIILAAPSGEGTVRRREGAELKDFELSEARLSRYSLFHPRTNGASEVANAWYQNNVEPSITCPQEERIGAHGEGGKWMCNIEALKEKKDCLIYSVGSSNDFTWEEEVKRRAPNCEIHTFDHTVANASNKPDDVFFHKWGLTENESHRNPNMKSLSEIIKALRHENRRLDVFKIDCEGCEWQTYKTWFTSGVQIVEILVETHRGSESPKPVSNAKQFFAHLHNSGYRIFHKEPNVHYSAKEQLCVEFALRRI